MFAQNHYIPEWKQVDSLLRLKQPQSAEQIVNAIYTEAQAQNNVAQLVKAHLYRCYSLRLWNSESLITEIGRTEEALAQIPAPAKNLFHSIAADLYWSYYQQNQRRFHNRSAMEVAPDDIKTWDLQRLVAQCIAHYDASLSDPQLLQSINIESLKDMLAAHWKSSIYRPTLYDFLAFRAVQFLDNNVVGLLQPLEPFLVNDPGYLAPASQFAALAITTSDSLSFKFKTLTLLQRILAFHLPDSDPVALIDADLLRLDYVHKHATFPHKDELYIKALQELDQRYAQLPISTEILFRIAKTYAQQGDTYHPYTHPAPQWKKKEAMDLIEKAIARFPNSFGARNGAALRDEIKQPDAQLNADDATPPRRPTLVSITYKNIPRLYYKIVPVDFKQTLDMYGSNEKKIAFYAQIAPVHSGQWDLPNTADYQQHVIEMAIPALQEGYYVMIASPDDDFSSSALVLTKAFWVSNLSYVWQHIPGQGPAVMVLDRQTGKPLSNVMAQEYKQEYNSDKRRYETLFGDTHRSDENGNIIPHAEKDLRLANLYFTHGKEHYASGEQFYITDYISDKEAYTSTVFFTDRAIYRPGQTVWFKGVVLKWDDGQASIVAKKSQTLTLHNANLETVSELEVLSNEFGSFSGSFTIPTAGLTGQMSIQTRTGSVSFRVEEYKRPKFEVKFEPLTASYRLDEEITLTAKAGTYAGSAVSGAKASYRVVRQAYYPLWRWWWGPRPQSASQEIAQGETLTQEDGSFTLSFTALPDLSIAKKDAPQFHYTVYATVSDINGETHEAQTLIPIGYQSLMVSSDIPERLNADEPQSVNIQAENLNGTPQKAQGTLTIWKLRQSNRVLQERRWPRPDQFSMSQEEFIQKFPFSVYDNEDQFADWEKEEQVCLLSFDTENATSYPLPHIEQWGPGKYIAEMQTQDAYGEAVENSAVFTLFSPTQKSVPSSEPLWFQVLNPNVRPGETLNILVGSAWPKVEAFYEVMGKDQKTLRTSILLHNEQKLIKIPITKKERGNFGVQLLFVHSNRAYSAQQTIYVPFDNKMLDISFASFRDKLQPGQEEEWIITIKDKAGTAVAAELLASMYDASLDAFARHSWSFFPWYSTNIPPPWRSNAAFSALQGKKMAWRYERASYATRSYDRLIDPYRYDPFRDLQRQESVTVTAYGSQRDDMITIRGSLSGLAESNIVQEESSASLSEIPVTRETPPPPSPAPLQIRSNFNETAFFFPQLRTNSKGETLIRFTVPEALTRWKMQGLAWTKDLQTGYISRELLTQKDLMIFTNPPRFFRENDTIWFSAKLSNISEKHLNIEAELQLFDALSMQPVSPKMLLEPATQTLPLKAGDSRSVSWKMHIPEGLQAVSYRITALSESFSDGEENVIPVLSNRMLVTESLPLPIRSRQTKSYEFSKLLHNQSTTLRNHTFTLEFTSNPVWNAIQSLPYIMEYPYECVEQTFSRYYANSIASHIVHSDPRIKQIFEIWRNYQPNALKSNLEKNEELKALLLEETPWVRAAQNESERKQRLSVLFDLNRMTNEMASALSKVEQAQLSNGGFAWFKGGRDDRYMTQHIVAGIGHLQNMGIPVKETDDMLRKAINYLDARIAEDFEDLKKEAAKRKVDYTKEPNLGYFAIHYLYARSFFYLSHPIPQHSKEALDFYLSQAARYWTSQNNNYMVGMLALSLHRFGNPTVAQLIMESLSQTALHSDEMGMYWKNELAAWWWYQAPIETQALLIEAYHEINNDQKTVDELKIWLLKQKQTQDWKTTKATTEAIYALLLTGGGLLSSDQLCQITVGDQTLDPSQFEEGNRPQAGTGYFKTSWNGEEVKPEMGKITVSNPNPTVAWGAAYWQYFEQLDKITPAETAVSIKKQLFVNTNTPNGPVLKEITSASPVKLGDKLTVRIEIRADRDMEYVHLKDMRAAAFEPLNVLSGYRWQDGLSYYESTRDAATNFFISYLRKGTYVFEYDLFATQQGEFSNGITSLQCMYAPEFTTHSEGIRVKVVE